MNTKSTMNHSSAETTEGWLQRLVRRHRTRKLRYLIEVTDSMLMDISRTAALTGYSMTSEQAFRMRKDLHQLRELVSPNESSSPTAADGNA